MLVFSHTVAVRSLFSSKDFSFARKRECSMSYSFCSWSFCNVLPILYPSKIILSDSLMSFTSQLYVAWKGTSGNTEYHFSSEIRIKNNNKFIHATYNVMYNILLFFSSLQPTLDTVFSWMWWASENGQKACSLQKLPEAGVWPVAQE